MKKKTRITIGILGFFLPVVIILIELLVGFPFPGFKLLSGWTLVLLLGSPTLFGLAIFSGIEMKFLARLGLFLGALVLYAIEIDLMRFIIITFTGVEGVG